MTVAANLLDSGASSSTAGRNLLDQRWVDQRRARSARSCTPGPVTRAATPTSGCGWLTTTTRRHADAEVARRDRRISWLLSTVTPDFVRDLLPEARDLEVEVHPLPNLGGVNVVLHGLLGQGVAASTRFDPQAKGLGEWARSRHVEIPEVLL